MSVLDSSPLTPLVIRADRPLLDEAHLAAVAFVAHYGGRTVESYRSDLRQFLQWCDEVDVAPLAATRAHIELYRAWMDERGLAASTVDRRLTTVCGYYRFAHIEGRISANPAQYVRRGADIEDLGFERGLRTLQIVGEGNRPAGLHIHADPGDDPDADNDGTAAA